MDAPSTRTEHEDASRSAAPDWNHVPFDVACARCGRDLRGLTEPKCPACALEFDWSDAVPIEQITCAECDYHLYGAQESRCPECGTKFDWDASLLRYRRMQRPLFEYRWRDEPVRSLVRTWRLLWRPKKFWKSLDLHDPPSPGPLAATWLITMLLYAGLAPVWVGIDNFVRYRWWGWGGPTGSPWWLTLIDLPTWVFRAANQWYLWVNVLSGVLWTLSSLAALLVFRQSMRHCKVKTAHVLRVWAYAVPQMLPLALLMFILAPLIDDSLFPLQRGLGEIVVLLVLAVFLIHVTWSLRCGYRYYLTMDRAWGVAIASQVMAALATMVLMLQIQYLLSRW
jgi:hypothetical protein